MDYLLKSQDNITTRAISEDAETTKALSAQSISGTNNKLRESLNMVQARPTMYDFFLTLFAHSSNMVIRKRKERSEEADEKRIGVRDLLSFSFPEDKDSLAHAARSVCALIATIHTRSFAPFITYHSPLTYPSYTRHILLIYRTHLTRIYLL